MRYFNYLILVVFLSQCASVKLDKNMPFTIKNTTYNTNTSELFIEYSSKQNISFQDLFYNNQKVKVTSINQGGKTYVLGNFKRVLLQDFTLHSDPKQEYGNKPTTTSKEKIPFELKENEAVISYKVNNEIKYYRIPSVTIK